VHLLVPEVDSGPDNTYLWAHRFRFVGGQSGLIGLWGQTAVFTVSEALGAEGAGASRSAEGWTCRVTHPWAPGRAYGFRVWTVEPGWWAASVTDEATAAETEIGFILVPPDWRQLDTPSVMSTEYQGAPLASCADLPHCRVVFSAPTADDGATAPERMHSGLGEGTCDSSRVEHVPGGVRHEIGGR